MHLNPFMMGSHRIFVLVLLFLLGYNSSATNISADGRAIIINGERKLLLSGAIHYPRSTAEMWPDLVQKAKEGGLDTIETYVFWNAHEPRRREYDFTGNLDLIKFIKIVRDAGLYVVLRIGPYACAEWNYGGFPVWLHQIPGIQIRTDNQIYKDEMQNFTTLIVDMIKKEKLLAPQGGPIIITQIENEYGNIMNGYGPAGKSYIQWCAKMAESLDVGVPWIMCQQSDAPSPMINTCNGFYCNKFKPNNPNSPKMWTENWTGWFKGWGQSEPHRPAEDVAYAVGTFFESGGTFQSYYMYHGGTNFGRTSGGPYLVTSYDYDAPLDEYGNLRQPKWGHLRQLHSAIRKMEKVLLYGNANTTMLGNALAVTKYTTADGAAGCFLVNANQSADAKVTFNANQYFLPARSVSILPDCKEEVYNTAKINTQTSLFVKKPMAEEEKPLSLNWTWRPEMIKDATKGKGSFMRNELLEQIMVTGDASDYLWYTTRLDLPISSSWKNNAILRVKTMGHVLHAFVNGRLIGSQYATMGNYKFVFEKTVKLRQPTNFIALLSATVGLANYGAHFDVQPTGIIRGPVELVGEGNETINLSNQTWSYKIGLNGEKQQIYSPSAPHKFKWRTNKLPTNKPMVWYKTTFEVLPGEDPLVLDLQGMGKGQAWVNGKSIGRFWPSMIAQADTCQLCDYRKPYDPKYCRTGCGEPSQRWYHVPRSFTTVGPNNVLILFEEAGGNPFNVSLQSVVVGTICANVLEERELELSCQGNRTISEIKFASFGDPQGSCGAFKKGNCEAVDSLDVVEKACLGRSQCSLHVATNMFGPTGCNNITKRLAVQAVC